jgi:hypothetical protein
LLAGHAQGAQQPLECLPGLDRRDLVGVAVQIEEKTSVVEPGGELVGGVDGQRGLADACRGS